MPWILVEESIRNLGPRLEAMMVNEATTQGQVIRFINHPLKVHDQV